MTPDQVGSLDEEEATLYSDGLEAVEKQIDIETVSQGMTLSLAAFERQAWNVVEPDTPLVWSWHYDYLCEWLTLVSTGEFKKQYPDKLGLIINVPPRTGKQIAHDEVVPTPDGWRKHGDLRRGDVVYGRYGQPVSVLAIGVESLNDRRVRFTDGGVVRCHAAHEWLVFDRAKHGYPVRVLETQQMECGWEPARVSGVTGPKAGRHGLWLGVKGIRGGRARFQVDSNVPLLGCARSLAIDPYVLGAWLGDGSVGKACITHSPLDIDHVQRVAACGYPITSQTRHKDTGVLTSYFGGGLHRKLRLNGFYTGKRIPEEYLFSSRSQRLALLAGLIDTDGCGDETGRYHFSNANSQLAEDVATLVRTLGWRACVSKAEPRADGHELNGRMIYDRQRMYIVSFNPDCHLPLALQRKGSDDISPLRRKRGIVTIEKCTPELGRCIQVQGGVYLVGKTMVPTHNSTFATVLWPVWTWLSRPSRRFLFGSHSLALSGEHNVKRSQLIRSEFFQERFGSRFRLITDGRGLLQNEKTGRFHITSIGSKQTGFGGLICVGDDLLDREDAFSESVKKSTNNWIDASFSNMLDDRVRGVFVHISQRLAVDDPTGHILGEDESTGSPAKWIQVKIAREALEDQEFIFPISKHKHVRPKGDILQAERCPPMVLADMKLKSRSWANQEQQEPTPETGALLDPNWLQWYKAGEALPTFYQVIISVDANFAAGKDNDLVAIHKYALVYNRRYLLDRDTEQIGYIALKQRIKEMARGGYKVPWMSVDMPPATQCLIENKANGPAVTEELRADPNFPLSVIEYNPVGSKTQRFIAATGDAEGRLIYFPEDAPWVGALRKQLCDYAGEGSVPHDDDCDAWSQFVNWSRQHQYGLLGYLEKQAAEAKKPAEEVYRCEIEIEGRKVVLEWDATRDVWVDPKTDQTYAQGNQAAAD